MNSERGFTLVELMVTVAVIGILAGVGVPYLLVNLPNIRVNGAVRLVVGDFRLARALAVERGVDCFLVFDAAASEYSVRLDTDGTAGLSAGDETVKTVSVPALFPGVEFSGSQAGDPVDFSGDRAQFKPRGTANGGTIYLRPARDAGVREDRDRRVTVLATTGRARASRWNPGTSTWEG